MIPTGNYTENKEYGVPMFNMQLYIGKSIQVSD